MNAKQLQIQRSNRRIAKMNEANRAAMQKGMKRRPVKNREIKASDISFGDLS